MTALPGKPAANATPDNGNGMDKLLATSPGARLQRAREAAKLSVNEAADSLHLSPGVVKALEADDFRSLPNATFVKGYLRSYSRLLGIPGEELVRTYESITGSNKPQPVTPIEAPRTAPKFATPVRFGVLLMVVLAIVWFFWPSNEDAPVALDEAAELSVPANESSQALSDPELEQVAIDSAEPSPQEPDIEVPEEEMVAPLQEVAPEPESEAEPLEPTSAADPVVGEPLLSQAPEPIPAQEQLTVEPPANEPEASPLGINGMVSMTFTGDCWVEVRDGTGELIYSNLKRNGESLTVKGVPPLEAKLGNGNVVSLSYNGQPVSFHIPPHNVVRVRLGE